MDLADSILGLGKHGMGKDNPATVWESAAAGPLAGLLYAAGPRGAAKGLSWVRLAAANADPDDAANPGWAQAAQVCAPECPALGSGLLVGMQMHRRQRDSLALTIVAALDEFGTPGAQQAARAAG